MCCATRIEDATSAIPERRSDRRHQRGSAPSAVSGLPQERALWNEIVEPALEGWLDSETRLSARRRDAARTRPCGQFPPPFPCADRHAQSAGDVDAPASLGAIARMSRIAPARTRCPILANVQDLRSPSHPGTHRRCARVFRISLVSAYHFVALQAVLAVTTTGGLRCSDVQSPSSQRYRSLLLLRYRYYNALFLRDELRTPVAVRPEPIARSFAGADPGGFVVPELDRRIEDILGPQPEEPRLERRAPIAATRGRSNTFDAPAAPPRWTIRRHTRDLAG